MRIGHLCRSSVTYLVMAFLHFLIGLLNVFAVEFIGSFTYRVRQSKRTCRPSDLCVPGLTTKRGHGKGALCAPGPVCSGNPSLVACEAHESSLPVRSLSCRLLRVGVWRGKVSNFMMSKLSLFSLRDCVFGIKFKKPDPEDFLL